MEHSPDRIRRVECVPFREAIKANVAFIMTAHVLVPSLDEQKPATLSRTIVHGLLRDELGYEGVILSDDLEMRALAATYTVPDAAVEAIAAGCDGVLVCRHLVQDRVHDIDAQVQVLEALIHAVEDERIPYGRIEDALARQRRAKERFLAAPTFAAHSVATGHAGRQGTRYRRSWGAMPIGRSPKKWPDFSKRMSFTLPGSRFSVRVHVQCSVRRSLFEPEHEPSSENSRCEQQRGAALMIKPRAVRPGDRIAVVSPASPFARDELERGVGELRRLGYEPVYEESIFDTALFTSGSAEARAAAFMRAWSDPEIAALIAVRGGYGSVQLLPVFDSWAPQRLPSYSSDTATTRRCCRGSHANAV